MSLVIRDSVPGDARLILRLISDLAVYERLKHEMVATESDLARELFGREEREDVDVMRVEARDPARHAPARDDDEATA